MPVGVGRTTLLSGSVVRASVVRANVSFATARRLLRAIDTFHI